MRAGTTKNSAGIGGKIENLPCMGAFTSITDGSEIQRRHARMYGKTDHLANDKLMGSKPDSDDDTFPLLDISSVQRVF